MRIAAFDCETAPALVYTYDLFKPMIGVGQIVEDPRMVCFAGRFNDRKRTEFYAEWDEGGHDEMVRQLWRMLDEADAVLHYNGLTFDEPWARTEFARLHLGPPSPFHSIDLFQQSKKFRLISHKLAYAASHLVRTDGKISASALDLYIRYRNGDESAKRQFRRYNVRDVDVLFQMLDELRPWLTLPNAQLYGAERGSCPRCGSADQEKRGYKRLSTGLYQQYNCRSCRGWWRDTHRLSGADGVGIAA